MTFSVDERFALSSTGHEPVMLLLHQSTYNPKGDRIPISTLKESRLNQFDHWVFSPVQVSHLLIPITKRPHYFYANRAIMSFLFKGLL